MNVSRTSRHRKVVKLGHPIIEWFECHTPVNGLASYLYLYFIVYDSFSLIAFFQFLLVPLFAFSI